MCTQAEMEQRTWSKVLKTIMAYYEIYNPLYMLPWQSVITDFFLG